MGPNERHGSIEVERHELRVDPQHLVAGSKEEPVTSRVVCDPARVIPAVDAALVRVIASLVPVVNYKVRRREEDSERGHHA